MGINAKYSHTNLAVRSIAAYYRARRGVPLAFVEFTINQRRSEILQALVLSGADCFLFSCYIWNIRLVEELVAELKLLRPQALLALGGPEGDWQAERLLQTLPQLDFVVRGEGEKSVCALLEALEKGEDPATCPGLALRRKGEIILTGEPPLPELGEIPFAYGDLRDLADRIPYYESMRGCPFRCSYCLSSLDRGVRFRPLELVFEELSRFLAQKVSRVKFVDRTFNCDPKRALEIWRFLREHDNGVTNFHFEMAGDLLDEEAVAFLSTVRAGLFQFEIGVQSTNPETLVAIDRACDFGRLSCHVAALQGAGRIHLHLDLIAGLPHEGYERFARSFDDVYRLAPHQLQLGFLKLLGGSAMRRDAEKYGMISQVLPPYQVLQTAWISYEELTILHGVEEMVERFYNSGRFRHILEYLLPHFPSPFAFYRQLWEFYAERQQGAPLSKIGYYDLLGDFMKDCGLPVTDRAQWLCKYDLLLHEKPRKLPGWVTVDLSRQNRERLASARKEAGPNVHLEVFPFLPPDGPTGDCVLAFDYTGRDITGRAPVSHRADL